MNNQFNFICELCNYKTDYKGNYKKHCQSSRHLINKRQSKDEKTIDKKTIDKKTIDKKTIDKKTINKIDETNRKEITSPPKDKCDSQTDSYENRLFLLEKSLVEFIKVQERRYRQINQHLENQDKRITRLLEHVKMQDNKNLEFDSRIDILEDLLPDDI